MRRLLLISKNSVQRYTPNSPAKANSKAKIRSGAPVITEVINSKTMNAAAPIKSAITPARRVDQKEPDAPASFGLCLPADLFACPPCAPCGPCAARTEPADGLFVSIARPRCFSTLSNCPGARNFVDGANDSAVEPAIIPASRASDAFGLCIQHQRVGGGDVLWN